MYIQTDWCYGKISFRAIIAQNMTPFVWDSIIDTAMYLGDTFDEKTRKTDEVRLDDESLNGWICLSYVALWHFSISEPLRTFLICQHPSLFPYSAFRSFLLILSFIILSIPSGFLDCHFPLIFSNLFYIIEEIHLPFACTHYTQKLHDIALPHIIHIFRMKSSSVFQ